MSSQTTLLITKKTAAQLLAVSTQTLWRWEKAGRLRPVRIGAGSTRYVYGDVLTFIEQARSARPAQAKNNQRKST